MLQYHIRRRDGYAHSRRGGVADEAGMGPSGSPLPEIAIPVPAGNASGESRLNVFGLPDKGDRNSIVLSVEAESLVIDVAWTSRKTQDAIRL